MTLAEGVGAWVPMATAFLGLWGAYKGWNVVLSVIGVRR